MKHFDLILDRSALFSAFVMVVIFSICERIQLLSYFLSYYSTLGATRFECALHNGEASQFYDEISSFKSSYDLYITPSIVCSIDEYSGSRILPALNGIRVQLPTEFKWYCIADLDEFYFFQGKSMLEMTKAADARGYDGIHGTYTDRIAANGSFPALCGTLDKTFPLACDLTRFCGGGHEKIAFAKRHIEISDGHHTARAAHIWRNAAEVNHFKWIEGIGKIMRDRCRRNQKQTILQPQNWKRLSGILQNGVDIFNPELNVRKASEIGI